MIKLLFCSIPIHENKPALTLEALYLRYRKAAWAQAYTLLQDDSSQVEDVVQEAFLRLADKIKKLEKMDEPAQYVYVIRCVRSTAQDFLKKKAAHKNVSLDELQDQYIGEDNVLDHICTQDNYRMLVEVIVSMPKKSSEVLYLYYINHMNLRQIAELLGTDYKAVQKRFERGKKKLSDYLIEKGWYHGEKRKTK